MTPEICTCGHPKIFHFLRNNIIKGKVISHIECRGEAGLSINCPCKKFTSGENHSQQIKDKHEEPVPSFADTHNQKTPPHDFVLSENIHSEHETFKGYVYTKDIKEFIKKDEDLIHLLLNGMITKQEFWNKRDKLAGSSLSGGKE